MRLPNELTLETGGVCNRDCPTCMRQTANTRRKGVMPEALYRSIIDQALAMGFTGRVNLQFFNEPLLDRRLPRLIAYAKDRGLWTQFYSNGDRLTPEIAAELDGLVDHIVFSLYGEIGGEPLHDGGRREEWIRRLFTKTTLRFDTGGHVLTHYSPSPRLPAAIAAAQGKPCIFDVQERLIVNCHGEMLLCCDDIRGEWDLGNVKTTPLADLWNSPKHVEIVDTLRSAGGRLSYAFCRECPR